MTPEFAALVNPTFQYVLELLKRIRRDERLSLEHERALIRGELEDAELSAASEQSRVKIDDFHLAKLCLVYWTDEVLTQATPDWKEITLEREYFGTRDRAWRFYVDGENKARRSSADVVETWYLALVLGFEGDIGEAFREHLARPLPGGVTTSPEARVHWANELQRQLRSRQFPELVGSPLEGDLQPQTGAFWLQISLVCLSLTAAAFAVLAALWWRTMT
jgi:hypothetical protein